MKQGTITFPSRTGERDVWREAEELKCKTAPPPPTRFSPDAN